MPDLLATFECNARDAAAGVSIIDSSPSAIRSAIQQLTEDAKTIVLGLGEFVSREIMEELRGMSKVIAEPTDEQLSVASVGVSDAFAGVASSGLAAGRIAVVSSMAPSVLVAVRGDTASVPR